MTTAPAVTATGRSADVRSLAIRTLCWAGLLIPPALAVPRPAGAIEADPITVISILKGGFPLVCLIAAAALARPRPLPVTASERWLAAYLALAVASTAWSVAPLPTLLKAGALGVSYGLLLLLARLWPSPEHGIDAIATVVYGVVIAAAIGAVVVPSEALYYSPGEIRLHGLVPPLQAVPLGMFAAAGVLQAWLGAGVGVLRGRRARIALGIVSLTVMLLTGSRSAFAVLAVGIVTAFALRRDWRKLAATALALTILAAGILLVPAAQPVRDRVTRQQGLAEVLSLNNRVPMWSDALQAWGAQPLVGLGYYAGHRFGPYAELFAARHPYIPADQSVQEGAAISTYAFIDGTWIETLLDLGIIGILLLAAFVVAGARQAHRTVASDPSYRVALGALLAGMIVYSIFDFTIQVVSYPMVALAGLLLVSSTSARLRAPGEGQDAGPVTPARSSRPAANTVRRSGAP